ncbi:MAG TPA: TetR/AcrR family transcriptional regulator [Actinomycetota bacterium]|jgi:AcrR family transcriptional regulator|nr:TetR/AcrR family transcriptional regulator [Actinomycetota bacterium]
MRTVDDLTAAARIREAAMRLFAERGVAAVSVRDIAKAAGVSPSLITHHYKSKDGLKAAVDERVAATLGEVFGEPFDAGRPEAAAASLAARFAAKLDAEPVLPAYVRRLLVDGGPIGEGLFRSLFDAAVQAVDALEEAGVVGPSDDGPARAALLMVSDLAVIILREQLTGVLGVDPLSAEGVARWAKAAMELYGPGLFPSEAST